MVWKTQGAYTAKVQTVLKATLLKTLNDSNWKNLSRMTGRPCKGTQRLWLRKKDPPGKMADPRSWAWDSHPGPDQPVSLMPTPTYNKIIGSTSCKPDTRPDSFIPRTPTSLWMYDGQWDLFRRADSLVAKLNESVGLINSHITTSNSRSMEGTLFKERSCRLNHTDAEFSHWEVRNHVYLIPIKCLCNLWEQLTKKTKKQ